MTRELFESFAQNGEDVVLWRALRNLPSGRYVEVGANDPVVDSISWPFYQRGWRGITVEPMASLAAAHRDLRPGDTQVEAVVGDVDAETVTFYEIPHTGLSTSDAAIAADHRSEGWEVVEREVPARRLDDVLDESLPADDREIHFLMIDTEGFEASVLRSLDLKTYRPWVLVIESTAPTSVRDVHGEWVQQVLDAGYHECLFDGLSRFYVAEEHLAELGPALSFPAGVHDNFTTPPFRKEVARAVAAEGRVGHLEGQVSELTEDVLRWRQVALSRWNDAASSSGEQYGAELGAARHELAAMQATLSWRITRPVRAVRTVLNTLRVGR